MQEIDKLYQVAKREYDAGLPSLQLCFNVARACLKKLNKDAALRPYGEFSGIPKVSYSVAEANGNLSRPYRPEFFISNASEFEKQITQFMAQMDDADIINKANFENVLYTVVSSFCLCYDVWKPKSRKTPGTFFEVFVGAACTVRYPSPKFVLSKHIKIEEQPTETLFPEGESDGLKGNSVSTDLVITNTQNKRAAVIPLKITTRERIVQPFAHQRILDSAYPKLYRSFLT
ncbi:MAG: hypothetical protein O3A08_10380 [Proteobacteria bacterium]|nr:hypothetical protein [Pseudomonadota bacterium]